MTRRPIPITDPRHLARTRRASTAMIACVVLAYAIILICFFNPTSMNVRIYAPFPFLISFYIIQTLLIRSFRLSKNEYPLLPDPHPLIFFVCLALITAAPFVAIVAHPSLPTMAYTGMVGVPLIAAGLAAAIYALLGTRAAGPACPGCAYALVRLRLPGPCPECGRPLKPADAKRISVARATRAPALWSGAGAIAAGLLFIFLVRNAPGALYRALPGPTHRFLASIEADALRTLDTTTLTPAQRATLADRILRERAHRKDPFEIMQQIEWLAGEIAAGRLTEEHSKKLLLDGLSLTLHPSGQQILRVGQPSSIGFNLNAEAPASRMDLFCIVRSLQVNGEEFADPTAVFTALELNPMILRTPLPGATLREGPRAVVIPTTPGPLNVQVSVLVFATPVSSPRPAVSSHVDGTPMISPAPIVTVELTAETTLTVSP